MQGLVEIIARALVDDPTPVEVVVAGSESEPVYRLRVGKDDLGKVIGKKGRTAKAFRTLIAAAAAKQNLRPTLEILEPERPRRADPEVVIGDDSVAAESLSADGLSAADGGAAADDG